MRAPVQIASHELHVTASIGIALSDPSSSADELLRDADLAMYVAKQNGRARWNCSRPRRRSARLLDDVAVGVAHTTRQTGQQSLVHRGHVAQHLAEGRHEQPADGDVGAGDDVGVAWARVEQRELAEVIARMQLTDLAAVAAHDRVAVEHLVERVPGVALADDPLARSELHDLDVLRERLAVTRRARLEQPHIGEMVGNVTSRTATSRHGPNATPFRPSRLARPARPRDRSLRTARGSASSRSRRPARTGSSGGGPA